MKPTKKKPVFKSDRAWKGKVIQTGEEVRDKSLGSQAGVKNFRYELCGDHYKVYHDGIWVRDQPTGAKIGHGADKPTIE